MKRILHNIVGNQVGLAGSNSVAAKQLIARGGVAVGDYGLQFRLGSPGFVCLDDDFLGDVIADQWNYVEGTDTTTADGAIVAAKGGVLRLTGGDSTGGMAADGAVLNSELNWYASQDGLLMLARVKLASIASVSCFIGFTDTKALEAPIQCQAGSGDTVLTNATDAVGFMFDTSMTTDNWWLTGVANDVDATIQNIGVAPVADTYEWLGVMVNSSGSATFFRNGLQVGTSMSGAVTPSVALTPHISIWPRSAVAGKTMDIDRIHVSAVRV
jgi:hypothetical protein